MTQSENIGGKQIAAFNDSLTKTFGPGNFPPSAVGDLSDLLDTFRRGADMLTELMDLEGNLERIEPARLLRLEILIADDLPMIARDLLPALKKMRKRIHSDGAKRK